MDIRFVLNSIVLKHEGKVMAIYKGNQKIATLSVGGRKISKVYKGSTLVFQDKIEEILTLYVYRISNKEVTKVFPSVSVGSYFSIYMISAVIQTITGTIGNAGSSISVTPTNYPQVELTFTFSKEVSLTGYKYYEYTNDKGYAYISPKQIINDTILVITGTSAEPITTYIITDVSGTTITINGNQKRNISVLPKTFNINYRA